MPNWKKVVTSGSNAHLNQITASGNISSSNIGVASDGIYAAKFFTEDNLAVSYNSGYRFGFANNTPISFGKLNNPTLFNGNITASGDISSSGTITMLTASIGGGTFTSASLAAGGGGGGSGTVTQIVAGDGLNGGTS